MGQRAGLVYGTGRPRLRDGTEGVWVGGLGRSPGPGNGTGLKGDPL